MMLYMIFGTLLYLAGQIHSASVPFGSGDEAPYLQGCAADIVFVLDESNSIWQNDLNKGKKFITGVIDLLDVARDRYQIAMISYGRNATIRFDLNRFTDKKKLNEHILSLRRITGTSTGTYQALKLLRENINKRSFGARHYVKKLAVLITDGGSTKPYLTKEQADLVHREQILVFGIGVSKKRGHLNETELKIISSDPDEKYTFTVENWGALDRIKEEVASRTCFYPTGIPITDEDRRGTTPAPTKPSQHPAECKRTDILFLPSESAGPVQLNYIGKYIKDITSTLDFRQGSFRLGVMPVPCKAWNGFDLHQYDNKYDISTKLEEWRFLVPDTATAIAHMRRKFSHEEKGVNPPGPRERTRKIGVVFVDHKSVSYQHTIEYARRAQNEGVEMFVIAVGDHYDDKEVEFIASLKTEDHVIKIRSYSQLDSLVARLSDAIKTCPSELPATRGPRYNRFGG